MSFNDDQKDYMRSLAAIPPEQRCYCAWFPLDKCPHCPPGMTLADRLKVECSECHNYPPALDPGRPIVHIINCSKAAGPELVECDQCGGSGFDTLGTGHGNVCGKCGGQKELPALAAGQAAGKL